MTAAWLVPGADAVDLPDGYVRRGALIGRAELLDAPADREWSRSDFAGRAEIPGTTSDVEARFKRRLFERWAIDGTLDPRAPTLDVGCSDGVLVQAMADLGFDRVVATDVVHSAVARLAGRLGEDARGRVSLVVDDLLRAPLPPAAFAGVVAWGVLSVTGDFWSALERCWRWVAPGGTFVLAEPLLEHPLVYAVVRRDIGELRRTLADHTRPKDWSDKDDRYAVWPKRYYDEAVAGLSGGELLETTGVPLLASLVLGGLAQDLELAEEERRALADELAAPALDELGLWRQGIWVVRKTG